LQDLLSTKIEREIFSHAGDQDLQAQINPLNASNLREYPSFIASVRQETLGTFNKSFKVDNGCAGELVLCSK
jgi:hypothetical protein